MKKNIFLGCGIGILIIFGIFISKAKSVSNDNQMWKDYKVTKINIENKNYKVVIANKPDQWQQGLMNIRKPVDFDGMLFVFPYKSKQSFWNKNTLVDLRLLWLSDGQVVGEVDLPSIEKSRTIVTVSSPDAVDSVLEIIK